jgi:beta-barrel assembly-enhancing protease
MSGRASYFDGIVSSGRRANVHITETDLVISCEDGLAVMWPLADVRYVDLPGDGQPVRLRNHYEHPDRLTLAGDFDLAVLRQRCPDLAHGNTGWSRNWKKITLWSGGAILSVAFLILIAIPIIANQIAHNLPEDYETRMGAEVREQIIKYLAASEGTKLDGLNLCSGQAKNDLDLLVKKLSGGLDNTRSLNLDVVNLDIENAFALPGGNILVFDGLLKNLKHPNELAGILSHEIAHAYYRHPTENLFKEIGTFAVIGLVFGDVTGGTVLAGLGKLLIGSAYSREAEREADKLGVELMNTVGFDARPLGDFLMRLDAKQGTIENMFSFVLTHPASKKRAEQIKSSSTGTGVVLPSEGWKKVQDICD